MSDREFKPYKCRVTTMNGLNLRKKPNGEILAVLPFDSDVEIINAKASKGVKWGQTVNGYINLTFTEKIQQEQG